MNYNDTSYYNIVPLAVWENDTFFFVGNRCEPQEKGKPIAAFIKTHPESKEMALLFRQVLNKWREEKRG